MLITVVWFLESWLWRALLAAIGVGVIIHILHSKTLKFERQDYALERYS